MTKPDSSTCARGHYNCRKRDTRFAQGNMPKCEINILIYGLFCKVRLAKRGDFC